VRHEQLLDEPDDPATMPMPVPVAVPVPVVMAVAMPVTMVMPVAVAMAMLVAMLLRVRVRVWVWVSAHRSFLRRVRGQVFVKRLAGGSVATKPSDCEVACIRRY
jgi:hypothetical protein